MRRLILILPGWLSEPGGESVLRQPLPGLSRLAEVGQPFKLSPIRDASVPEAAYLGINPYTVQMSQGPLTVSALGFDPPARSVHFHLSFMSLDSGGSLRKIGQKLPEGLIQQAIQIVKRLDTSRMTTLQGIGTDHALVVEDGSAELRCSSPDEAAETPYAKALPEGDGEAALRRYIDDSVNLLAEQEFNLRRIDEGLDPVNIVWPWGPGFRFPVPNLLLKTGPVQAESPSLRLAGIARLARYRHGDIQSVGEGTAVRFESLLKTSQNHACTILLLPQFGEFRKAQKLEELDWLTRELDRRLLTPLAEEMAVGSLRVTLLAPSDRSAELPELPGLMLEAESHRSAQNVYPFDERSLEERMIPTKDVWQAVEDGIRWVVGREG